MNRLIMVAFGLALLLLLELLSGDLGFYFPFTAFGLFYFTVSARRRWYWFLLFGAGLGALLDGIYGRPDLWSVAVELAAVLLGWRYRTLRNAGTTAMLLFGMGLGGGAALLQHGAAFIHRGVLMSHWQNLLAYSLFSALFGALAITVLAISFDSLAGLLNIRRRFDVERTEMDRFNASRPEDED